MTSDNNIQFLPTPPGLPRVETGTIQFGDDWPGLFIRGDAAHALMISIRKLASFVADHPSPEVADLLRQLQCYADTIERDVILMANVDDRTNRQTIK